jgi:hypothetical protein
MVLREDGFAAVLDPDDGDAETRDAHRPAPAALPRCVHVLAAFDAMLRTLGGDDAAARALAAVIEREPWQLVLAHLEHLDAPVAGALPGEVWWRLRERYGQLELTPTIRKPQARGLSRGSAIPANELRSGRYDVAPVDRTAGAALESYGTPLPPQVRAALVMLIGHPRVVADTATTPIAVRARGWRSRWSRRATLRLVPTVDGGRCRRRAARAAAAARGRLPPGDGECLVIDTDRRSAGLLAAIERYGDRFPPTAHAALLDKLAAVDDRLPVAVPAALLGAAWATAPRVVLRVRLDPDGGLALEAWIRPAPEAPLVTPGEGREVLPLVRDGQRGHVRRELADEEARVARAIAALPVAPTVDDTGPRWRYRVTDGDDALTLEMALDELPAGVTAEGRGARPCGATSPRRR